MAWGKLGPDGRKLALVDHCLDVACVFRALLDLPNLARWAPAEPVQKDRLAVLAFLHDFGKCNRGFQNKSNPLEKDTATHVLEAVALLRELRGGWPRIWRGLIEDLVGWFGGDECAATPMLLAAISHHGRPISIKDYENAGVDRNAGSLWQRRVDYDPMMALVELAESARAAFPAAFDPGGSAIEATPALQQRFAGLLMLADWIASDTRFFPLDTPDGEDRAAFTRRKAPDALRTIGLVPPADRRTRTFSEVFSFQATALQEMLAETLPVNDDSRLVLVESGTGSGKTEAALAWFFRLYNEGKVDGLYFALPTRVAARELYSRVRRAVEAAFEPANRPHPVLLAVPAYVKVDEKHALPEPSRALWDDPRDLRRENLWSAERPKRFLAAPVAVGTIDQALLSVLQVKHSLLRSVCLDRHLLVVDEVHASDPYMSEVLRALLDGHLARGGWALLLSATLGEAAAASFFGRAPLPIEQAIVRPYPSLCTRSEVRGMPPARTRQVEIRLSPTLEDDAPLVPLIVSALQRGARVLVVCNTVARANGLFRRVEAELEQHHPELLDALFALKGVRCPHHGRFAREDREQLDKAVTATLGKDSSSGARLLIGTQTLEQSLDIDADWLITDLAPMDVLIQRMGRLHRHDRNDRPQGFETPCALVRVPDKDLADFLQKDGALNGPAGLGKVYPDGRVLKLTMDELARRDVLCLPQDARALIEHTTHQDALRKLSGVWDGHGNYIEGQELAEVRAALRSVLDDKLFGELHYADKSECIVTRLGEQRFDLPLARPMASPFGMTIHRVLIPERWLKKVKMPDEVSAETIEAIDGGFQFRVADRGFRYTRYGLELEKDTGEDNA